MHIGFDAKRAFTNTSGLGNYSRFVIGGMLRMFPHEQYSLFTPRQHELFRDFWPLTTPQVSVVEPTGLARRGAALWRTFGMAAALPRHGVQIYHGLSNELPYGVDRSRTKLVVTIHDLIFRRFPHLYPAVDRLIYNRKFRDACARADQVVAISQQTAQDLTHYYGLAPDRIRVIYQDCDPVFHQLASFAARQAVRDEYDLPLAFILCVGTLEPRKNQLHLLKAWHAAGAPLPLVFVGRRTEYYRQLEAYIQQHDLGERVQFLPYIPFRDLPLIYQLATVFVYPSLFEGFGIPIVEALNSGVPVITSTGSCFAEAGGDAAHYVPPTDVDALTQALKDITANPSLRRQMIERGHRHALTFRPEVTIPQLHQLYQAL